MIKKKKKKAKRKTSPDIHLTAVSACGVDIWKTQLIIFPVLLDTRRFFPAYLFKYSILLDDLPLFVKVQHHPDAVSGLVDLLDVVLAGDFHHLPEHVLQLSRLPLRKTLLSARRHISYQCAVRVNRFQSPTKCCNCCYYFVVLLVLSHPVKGHFPVDFDVY